MPEQSNISKDLLRQKDSDFHWGMSRKWLPDLYCRNKYKDVHQRWCVVFSKQAYKREIETLREKWLRKKR